MANKVGYREDRILLSLRLTYSTVLLKHWSTMGSKVDSIVSRKARDYSKSARVLVSDSYFASSETLSGGGNQYTTFSIYALSL